MTTHYAADTVVLTGRSMRHVTRSLDTIITTAITPVAIMLLFVYVFGGAIDTGSVDYVTYMLPGILLITIASGVAYTSLRLFTDLQSGIFERFQSMPIARSAGDHQRENARAVVKAGGAILMEEPHCLAGGLAPLLRKLVARDPLFDELRRGLRPLARTRAAEAFLADLRGIVGR